MITDKRYTACEIIIDNVMTWQESPRINDPTYVGDINEFVEISVNCGELTADEGDELKTKLVDLLSFIRCL